MSVEVQMDFVAGSVNNRKWNTSERGTGAYALLGWLIIVVVALGVVFVLRGASVQTPADSNLKAATDQMAKQNWNDAVVFFGKSLEVTPGNVDALVGRSRAYVQLRQFDKALEDVNVALKKDQRNAGALGQRALVAKLQGQHDAALADLVKAVKENPNFAWGYAQIADISLKRNELDKALENAGKALKANQNFPEGLRLRAKIYAKQGKCKEAYEDLEKAVKMRPNDAVSLQDKAWFLLTCPEQKMQDPPKAMEIALKANELSKGLDALTLETLAEAFYKQGDVAKASEHQQKAVDLMKKNCPDGSCLKEMLERLQKYQLANRREQREEQEILPLDSSLAR
jgi:tetratricopeptide (TPR) repeat protein